MNTLPIFFVALAVTGLAQCSQTRNRFPGPDTSVETEWPDNDPQCSTPDGYFAHPLFCDQYYRCTNGKSKLYRCSNGLIFNDEKKYDEDVCDYPWIAKCRSNLVTLPTQPSIPHATEEPATNSYCPRDWGLYPHETDCGKFYNCANGYAYPMVCPPGLHFNPYDLVCDWPDSARCAKTTNEYACPKASGLFGLSDGDCSQFIMCIHSFARLLSCPPNSFFDNTIGYCVKGYKCGSRSLTYDQSDSYST